MPRIKPTTVITQRVRPTTTISRPRVWVPISWDSTLITFDSNLFTFDMTKTGGINTTISRPRYNIYVQDMDWNSVFDMNWNQVLWISWNTTNKITTIIT